MQSSLCNKSGNEPEVLVREFWTSAKPDFLRRAGARSQSHYSFEAFEGGDVSPGAERQDDAAWHA